MFPQNSDRQHQQAGVSDSRLGPYSHLDTDKRAPKASQKATQLLSEGSSQKILSHTNES